MNKNTDRIELNLSRANEREKIEQFYSEFGIKQYGSFSGGFRYHEKTKASQQNKKALNSQLTRERIYKQFGVSRKANFPEFYKVEKDYVPQTKSELADKLVQKLQHQMKKMKYYRQKYHSNQGV